MGARNASGDTIVFVSARRVETIQRETLRGSMGDFHRTIEKIACNSKGVSSNACARHVLIVKHVLGTF